MGMYFQDDFWETVAEIEDRDDQDKAIASLVRFFFTGEEPSDLTGTAKMPFLAFRGRIGKSKINQRNASGRRSETLSETESETPSEAKSETESETPSETRSESTSETESETVSESRAFFDSHKKEREREKEEIPNGISKKTTVGKIPTDEADRIIAYFNEATNSNYKPRSKLTLEKLNARWREGYRFEDFKAVIDDRVRAWKGDPKSEEWLRPKTLFSENFESYLQTAQRNLNRGRTKEGRYADYS